MATEEHTKKRKLQDDDKPRKKEKKQKKVREDESDLDMEAGLNRAFERMDGQLLADHIAQKTRRFGTELSPVELSDLYISGESHTQFSPGRGQGLTAVKQTRSGTAHHGISHGLWRICRAFWRHLPARERNSTRPRRSSGHLIPLLWRAPVSAQQTLSGMERVPRPSWAV
jgi:hypothetical protein